MDVLVILAMLAVNSVFAAYEMALASVSRARLEVLAQAKRRGAASAVYMKERLEGSLAVIQLGITLAGAIAAATGGAAVDQWLAPWLMECAQVSAQTANVLALVMLVIPLSALTIIFAELVPKMIGITHKDWVVLTLSPTMKAVAGVFHPVVFVFEGTVKLLMRLGWKFKPGAGASAADQSGLLELRAAAALARATRIIGPMEERIVVAAAQLSCRTVKEVMVPVQDIKMFPLGMSIAEALMEAHVHMHSRYPVCREPGDAETIEGYVTFKDIVGNLRIDPTGGGLRGIMRPIRRIDLKINLAQALTNMIRDKIHIALATENGKVYGLLTLEEVVEELVGDIDDEYDRLPSQIHPIGGGWFAGGGATVGDLAKAIGGGAFADADAKTLLADWASRTNGATPRSGDVIKGDGVAVLVRKTRRSRVAEAIIRVGGAAVVSD
jgi:putative hemolysin